MIVSARARTLRLITSPGRPIMIIVSRIYCHFYSYFLPDALCAAIMSYKDLERVPYQRCTPITPTRFKFKARRSSLV